MTGTRCSGRTLSLTEASAPCSCASRIPSTVTARTGPLKLKAAPVPDALFHVLLRRCESPGPGRPGYCGTCRPADPSRSRQRSPGWRRHSARPRRPSGAACRNDARGASTVGNGGRAASRGATGTGRRAGGRAAQADPPGEGARVRAVENQAGAPRSPLLSPCGPDCCAVLAVPVRITCREPDRTHTAKARRRRQWDAAFERVSGL